MLLTLNNSKAVPKRVIYSIVLENVALLSFNYYIEEDYPATILINSGMSTLPHFFLASIISSLMFLTRSREVRREGSYNLRYH